MSRAAYALVAFLALVPVACGGAPGDADADAGAAPAADLGGAPGKTDGGELTDGGLLGGTYLLTLDAGAFPPTPAHPSALVYVPPGLDPAPPLSLVVYIHGFENCVENIVRDTGQPCAAGMPVRNAYSLAAQLRASGRNAILLCPEVAFDQRSADPGSLGVAGGFRTLLAEALRDLPGRLRTLTPADVGVAVLASHSGGYRAAAAIAAQGGVPISEVYLLDSLYGSTAEFDAWVQADLPGLSGAAPRRRFADVYTTAGGTLAESQAMAARARAWVAAEPSVLIDDRTTATWPDATYHHGLLFKLSMLSHDGVPRYYFEKLLATSRLPRLPAP